MHQGLLKDSVKVKISYIYEIVIGVWSLEHLKCAMFVAFMLPFQTIKRLFVVAYCTQFFTRLANYLYSFLARLSLHHTMNLNITFVTQA